jgi:hypothetical protein
MASTSKRSAKVICHQGCVWVSPKQFWRWVREEVVEYVSEPPLTGRFSGLPAHFLVTVERTLLDQACPEHMHAVLLARRRQKGQR